MLAAMSYTDDERRRIADAVRRARVEQELDKEPAARAAKVSSITWKRVEDAEGVRDASLGKVLSSLGLPDAGTLLTGRSSTSPSGHRRSWTIMAELSSRLAASLRGQAELYEWTQQRLPKSEHAEHDRIATAAAEPLLSTAADYSQSVLDATVDRDPEFASTAEFTRLSEAAARMRTTDAAEPSSDDVEAASAADLTRAERELSLESIGLQDADDRHKKRR